MACRRDRLFASPVSILPFSVFLDQANGRDVLPFAAHDIVAHGQQADRSKHEYGVVTRFLPPALANRQIICRKVRREWKEREYKANQ